MTSIHRTSGALVLATALLTACSGTGSDSDSDTAATTTTSSSQSSSAAATSTSAGSASSSSSSSSGEYSDSVDAALAALRTAADAVPNGRPYDLEQDDYDGQQAWEIKVASDGDKFKLYVSADGSDVLNQKQDPSPGDDLAKVQQARVEAMDALQTAADANPGAELDELEIDTRRDGTLIWEIEFYGDSEVYVDAITGEIVR